MTGGAAGSRSECEQASICDMANWPLLGIPAQQACEFCGRTQAVLQSEDDQVAARRITASIIADAERSLTSLILMRSDWFSSTMGLVFVEEK